jgi:hypothetical protein
VPERPFHLRVQRPFLLRLPFELVDRGFDLPRVLSETAVRWRDGFELLEEFALRAHEKEFARKLLSSKRNLWLYRANQRLSCGDFVVVDMSPPLPDDRTAFVLELKQRQRLVVNRRGGSVQLKSHEMALAELAAAGIWMPGTDNVVVLCGDDGEILDYLKDDGATNGEDGR